MTDPSEAMKEKARAILDELWAGYRKGDGPVTDDFALAIFARALASVRAEAVAAERERAKPFVDHIANLPLWRDTYPDAVCDTVFTIGREPTADMVRAARAIRDPDRQQGE